MKVNIKIFGIILLILISMMNSACNAVISTPKPHFAYITNQGDNTVSVINTSTNQVINTIKVGEASSCFSHNDVESGHIPESKGWFGSDFDCAFCNQHM